MSARPDAEDPPEGDRIAPAEDEPVESGDGDQAEPADDAEGLVRPLPESVRLRVVEYGSDVLGGMRPSDLPPSLRRVAKFEPRRRAKLAGPQIAARLESDADFRGRVAARVEQVWPEVAEGVRAGVVPPAADPVAVAAVAYLLRPEGWSRIIEDIHLELERRHSAKEVDEVAEALEEARRELLEVRRDHDTELARLRAQIGEQRNEIAELRRKVHHERQRAKAANTQAEQVLTESRDLRGEAEGRAHGLELENRRLRSRLADAQAQVENARRAARSGRNADEARLRVLLDVLVEASHGLRRELALPTGLDSPADLVAEAREELRRAPLGGLPDDDPGLLAHLLTVPRVHLLVDGYNVTKTGYGTMPLIDQRNRLLASLEGLASRTKAEITCVFDGADVDTPPVPPSRRVRLLFSAPGETADELIIRLVRAEPPGRPIAVVTSDKEIVQAVRRCGARAVPSPVFLRRLD